jgi:hypothetical protein
MEDPEEFVLHVAMNAPKEFDRAFDRWRELYNSARTQLAEANARSEITGLSAVDRRKIKAAQMQASDQIAILEQGKASNGSDFYSYRYLATEGFLPGYNFPRLPLYAFVPGEGKTGSFLSRARFLAISEFGPRSLIYHEGRACRVMKAKLPPEVREGDGSELATKDIYICANCGACHEGEVERCHGCDAHMAGEVPIRPTRMRWVKASRGSVGSQRRARAKRRSSFIAIVPFGCAKTRQDDFDEGWSENTDKIGGRGGVGLQVEEHRRGGCTSGSGAHLDAFPDLDHEVLQERHGLAEAAGTRDESGELVDQLTCADDQRPDAGPDQRPAQDDQRRGEATDGERGGGHASHPAAREKGREGGGVIGQTADVVE